MHVLTKKLVESDNNIARFLLAFRNSLQVVGSRGRGDHEPDSDVDLHIKDMMETDETFDSILVYLSENGIQHGYDKWSSHSITIPPQLGFPVAIDIGYWTGVPNNHQQIDVFGVLMDAPCY